MKNRKLKAILAIASAIAMLTVSMAGFAATVSTLTKYNLTAGKVDVTTTVTEATNDSLITYLVQDEASKIDDENGIVYIDQKKVVNGSATFNYVIDKDNMTASLSGTTVTMGTNNPANTNLATSLAFQTYATQTGAGELYTVTYSNATIGNDETTVATITAADGYEIDFYTITGDETEHEYTGPVTLAYGKDITNVAVSEQEKAPVVSGDYSDCVAEGKGVKYTQVINVESAGTATIAEIGLYWNGMRYPAMVSETEKATTTAAVQIIDPNTTEKVADAAPYYIVGNKMYKVDGTVWFE